MGAGEREQACEQVAGSSDFVIENRARGDVIEGGTHRRREDVWAEGGGGVSNFLSGPEFLPRSLFSHSGESACEHLEGQTKRLSPLVSTRASCVVLAYCRTQWH